MPSDSVRVSLRIPKEIHDFIKDSCTRIKVIDGKQVQRKLSLNDAYVDFL
jgi:hypothetical protein